MHLASGLLLFLFCCCLWGSVHAEENPPESSALLPERLDYRPYLADPRRPRFGAALLKGTGDTLQYDIPFGGAC